MYYKSSKRNLNQQVLHTVQSCMLLLHKQSLSPDIHTPMLTSMLTSTWCHHICTSTSRTTKFGNRA